MPDPQPIWAQLRQARLDRGMQLEQLVRDAGLACSADSLSRKLNGKQPLTTDEAEHVARALDYAIVLSGPSESQAS